VLVERFKARQTSEWNVRTDARFASPGQAGTNNALCAASRSALSNARLLACRRQAKTGGREPGPGGRGYGDNSCSSWRARPCADPVSKAEQAFSRSWRDAALVPRTSRSPSTFAPWFWFLRWRDGAVPVIHQHQGLRPQCGRRVVLLASAGTLALRLVIRHGNQDRARGNRGQVTGDMQVTGVTGDRPRLFLHIAQNRSSTIGSARLRGRPDAPGVARRPSAREICSVNCESPSAKFPLVARRSPSMSCGSS
jgi:hypothetical protein